MSTTDGYEFEVLRNYDTLQRVVRNPDYERLCQDLIFDKDGFAQIDTILLEEGERAHQEKNLEEIRERFGLAQPIHPSVILENKCPPEFFSQTAILEKDPFACMLVFHRTRLQAPAEQRAGFAFPGSDDSEEIVVSPIHEGHYIILDIDLSAPPKAINSAVKEYMGVFREQLPMGLQTGRDLAGCLKHIGIDHLRLKIDLMGFEKTAMETITRYLSPIRGRMHFDKRTACYAVWDERKACESAYVEKLMTMPIRARRDFIWKSVAVRLSTDEDTVRKRYARAHYLITGRRYGEGQWHDEKAKCLIKKAERLSGGEQVSTWEEILRLEGMPSEPPKEHFFVRTDVEFLGGDKDPAEF